MRNLVGVALSVPVSMVLSRGKLSPVSKLSTPRGKGLFTSSSPTPLRWLPSWHPSLSLQSGSPQAHLSWKVSAPHKYEATSTQLWTTEFKDIFCWKKKKNWIHISTYIKDFPKISWKTFTMKNHVWLQNSLHQNEFTFLFHFFTKKWLCHHVWMEALYPMVLVSGGSLCKGIHVIAGYEVRPSW